MEKFNKDRNSRDKTKCKYTNVDNLTSNDPSYYSKNAEDYAAATKVQWVETLGRPVPKFDMEYAANSNSNWNLNNQNTALAGIMKLSFVSGPGTCSAPGDDVNRAFSQLMADLYAKTSASTLQFQAADLAMYVATQSSIAYLIATAKRALKARTFWINRNTYYPRALLQSMGFTYADINSNYPEYKSKLNAAIRQFNNINILKIFDIYPRQYSLCTNVYVDEDSPLGQIYFFEPTNYYEYDDSTHSATSRMYGGYASFAQLLGVIETLLDAWYNSQDMYYISGTLRRAYKDAEYFVISEFTDDDILEPVTENEESKFIFEQIMNATILPVDNVTCNITQDPTQQAIIWQPRTSAAHAASFEGVCLKGPQLLRCYEADPTADEIMEMTRLMSRIDLTSNIISGPEIINEVTVYRLDGTTLTSNVLSSNYLLLSTNSNLPYTRISLIGNLSAFRYIPRVWLIAEDSSMSPTIFYAPYGLLGDQYNYTSLSVNAFNQLLRTAILSLYKIPF